MSISNPFSCRIASLKVGVQLTVRSKNSKPHQQPKLYYLQVVAMPPRKAMRHTNNGVNLLHFNNEKEICVFDNALHILCNCV